MVALRVTGFVVRCNRTRLIQAVSNIVLNAVQATPDGGTVSVRARGDDQSVMIHVHNTGSYIPTDTMKRLFVPFFTTKPSGTGLGLAIARQIVGASSGRIDVESDPASGTTFIIQLPVAEQGAPSARDDGQKGPPLTKTA